MSFRSFCLVQHDRAAHHVRELAHQLQRRRLARERRRAFWLLSQVFG